jgi:hypothetical protein
MIGGQMAIPQPIRKPMRAVFRRVQAEVLVSRIALHTLDTELMRKGREMQCLSRKSFGWSTPHRTRWWEYPWILREVERRLDGRTLTALDAGAGKSPMPIALAGLGLKTTVADPNSQEKTGKNSGGEWDWTDYSPWGVETRCAGMEEKIFKKGSLGVAVSVSVIEHIPAEVRRAGLKALSTALEPGGLMVFTVDLVKGSRQLWNRVLDIEVEPLAVHGSVEDMIAEADAFGMRLVHQELCPVSTDHHDILGLVFEKKA